MSIAAIVSLLLFGVVAGAGVRSFWIWDGWTWNLRDYGDNVELDRGGLIIQQLVSTATGTSVFGVTGHYSAGIKEEDRWQTRKFASGFGVINDYEKPPHYYTLFQFRIPLWFPLLLLLIAPLRSLIARPTNAPAFPVITKHS